MNRTNPPIQKKKRITIQSAKTKGRNLQQWASQKISDFTGLPWGPDELIASREGCQNGTDVRLIGEARKLFPFSVECKAQEAWAIHAWMEQAKTNQEKGMAWLLIAKRSRQKPIVIMDAKTFFEIIKGLDDLKERISL